MKILTAKQVYEADKATVDKQAITPLALMERAATKVFQWIDEQLKQSTTPIYIFCGIGNNGGDGMALGRMLIEKGYNVTCFIVNYSDKRSKCFLINYGRIKEIRRPWPELLDDQSDLPQLPTGALVVDCIFGIGLNRPMADWVKKLIQHINSSKTFVLSVDVPSGLFVDAPTPDLDAVIRAGHTLSFQVPKLVFYLPQTAPFTGDVSLLDIGLDIATIGSANSNATLVTKSVAQSLYRPRKKFSHKGTYGHAVIVGGSYGMIGAVSLSTQACLRSGVGKVTALIPECGYHSLQTAVPEAMVATSGTNTLDKIAPSFTPDALGIGCGMGTSTAATTALTYFLKNTTIPLVIDADALNNMAAHKELYAHIPKTSILTPHIGELKRLVGEWKNDFEMLDKVQAFSKKHDIVIVVKNSYTLTVYKELLYVNSSGNHGMATAGSGDVLAGLITGLLAQGYASLQAATLGVYLHGIAGDLAVGETTAPESLIARDLVHHIGQAYRWLTNVYPQKNNQKE